MSVAPNPTFEHRDIRSATLPFKRDKDHTEKWINGARPGTGPRVVFPTDELATAVAEGGKVRPFKPWSSSEHKTHANKSTKPYGTFNQGSGSNKIDARQVKKVDAIVDANDTSSAMSKSLLELLPQHSNNTQSAIQIALFESAAATDGEILYSFDNKGPSPGANGRNVDLGGLVDMAEKKWSNKEVDRIVKGEYEVLDNEGEVVTIKAKGKKSPKHSPKQKATKVTPVAPKSLQVEEDDGFELI